MSKILIPNIWNETTFFTTIARNPIFFVLEGKGWDYREKQKEKESLTPDPEHDSRLNIKACIGIGSLILNRTYK